MIKIHAKQIDALLPQTQCRECGYAGCLPYAQALADGKATIDLCAPGGLSTLEALGDLLQIDTIQYRDKVLANTRQANTVVIRENECIGCTKCIQACPVDAIIGTAKHMHSVLTDICTGCGLCIEPCPVDCINTIPLVAATYNPSDARQHYQAKQLRLAQATEEADNLYYTKRCIASSDVIDEKQAKQEYIMAALTRVTKV